MSTNNKRAGRSAAILFASAATLVAAGCTSISKNPVARVMPAADDFKDRVESIEPGDSYDQVLAKLQMSDSQFQNFSATMDDSDAYSYVYGDVAPAEGTRLNEYDRLEGVTLSYQNVTENLRYGLTNTKTEVVGDELNTVIIFRDGAVMNDPGVSERDINGTNNESHLRRLNPFKFIPGL